MSTSQCNPADHNPLTNKARDGSRPSENDPQLSHLTRRQTLALPILVAAPNMTQAAHDAGISESTLYRWLQDENFRAELRRLTVEAAERTRQQLQSLTLRSLKVLTDLMEDADPIVRLRAARTVAAMGIRTIGVGSLPNNIQNPEECSSSIQQDQAMNHNNQLPG